MAVMTPLEVVAFASVLVWPLIAGVAVVLWSRARAAAHARRVAAMESDLQGLYQSLESLPIPSRLTMVVDALEEGEALAGPRTRAPGKLAPSSGS
jgi:hypothetical protein